MFRKFRETVVGLIVAIFVIGIAVGPFMAWFGWSDGQRIAQVLREGVETKAIPESGTRRTGRRSGTSYSLNLVWQTPEGARVRAEGLSISAGLAGQILSENRITRTSLNIKYLASDTAHPVILEDAAYQQGVNDGLLYTGLGWFGVGVVSLWLLRRRLRRRQRLAAQPA
ncbi:hypothetical protein ACE7GA_14360 [Roseomonas sp. CCTCC AB2023176]|uniref:hypothetical protein n=1 Tax=Roseomonas sp. CCTCC AB2023176 TaxID=3342640 RepID=UPI0035E164A0